MLARRRKLEVADGGSFNVGRWSGLAQKMVVRLKMEMLIGRSMPRFTQAAGRYPSLSIR